MILYSIRELNPCYRRERAVSWPLDECCVCVSGRRGSNSQPTAWKAVTLPLSYFRIVYLWRDLNPHALASDPKSDVSADSTTQAFMAEEERFELPQPFGRLFSRQLQYHYAIPPSEPSIGFEPTTCWLQISCTTVVLRWRFIFNSINIRNGFYISKFILHRWQDSNLQHSVLETDALPLSYTHVCWGV